MAFHEAAHRNISRHGAQIGLLLDEDNQVVEMELVAPTGVLAVLGGQGLSQFGSHCRMGALVGADLALEHLDWAVLALESFVVPSLDGRAAQRDPLAMDGMAP